MKTPLISSAPSRSKKGQHCSFANLAISSILVLAAVAVVLHDHAPEQEARVAERMIVSKTDNLVEQKVQPSATMVQRIKTRLLEEKRVAEEKSEAFGETPVGGFGCPDSYSTDNGGFASGVVVFSQTVFNENKANIAGQENVIYTGAAEAFVQHGKDNSMQELFNFHAGNHVLAPGSGFDGLNPVPIFSIAIAATLEAIPALREGDGKLLKWMINAVVKVIGLSVGIASYGTVAWIAVPLAAVFLLMSFMEQDFDDAPVGKQVHEILNQVGTGFQKMVANALKSTWDAIAPNRKQWVIKLVAFAEGLKQKLDAAMQSKLVTAAAEMTSNIATAASKGLNFLVQSTSWASCMLAVSLGLEQSPEKTAELKLQAQRYYSLQYKPWNCKATGFYGLVNQAYDSSEFGLCCQDPVISIGAPREDINGVKKPLNERQICSMWDKCCTTFGQRGGANFDMPCCIKSSEGKGMPTSSLSAVYPAKNSVPAAPKVPQAPKKPEAMPDLIDLSEPNKAVAPKKAETNQVETVDLLGLDEPTSNGKRGD